MKIKSMQVGVLALLGGVLAAVIFGGVLMRSVPIFADDGRGPGESFVTIYDAGKKTVVKSGEMSVREVLEKIDIAVDEQADIVEPGLDEEISGRNFYVNIYRARPVVVIDGVRVVKLMSAASVPRDVAVAAGVKLRPEDIVKITMDNTFMASGVPYSYLVVRAKLINFDFYGAATEVWTQAGTVGEFLAEHGVELTDEDWLSTGVNEKVKNGMALALYRNGKNTVTVEESVPYAERIIHDYAKNVGYREVSSPGKEGRRTVTYEIEMYDGKEVGRVKISEIVTLEPVEAIVTVGAKAVAMQPLTKSMGRNKYTLPNGILRQETYYDLPMARVMQNCGGGGYYTVRADGVKVDKDGYVIVAAELGRYPRCSLVETSLGMGKVYDTGTFTLHNPEQIDIATDWTKRDGI